MSEGLSCAVWQTLPSELQRRIVFTLGRMAMRQIQSASTSQERGTPETSNDHWGSRAAAGRGPVREDLSASPRTLGDRLHPAVDDAAGRASSGVDTSAIRFGGSRLPTRLGTRD